MEIKELENRIEKKKADIEKTKRSINKFITKNNFSEEDQEFALTNGWKDIKVYAEANWPRDYGKVIDFEDLKRRYSTLAEQEVQLQKYTNQLALMQAKADKEANTAKIPTIVKYLEWVKEQWVERVQQDITVYEDVILAKYDEYLKTTWNYCWDNKLEYDRVVEDQKYKEYRALAKKYTKSMDPLTLSCYNSRTRTFDWDRCNAELDKDTNVLYWDLVNRITDKVGEIIDASNLSIGAKGNLNGIVKGTEGSVVVETIPAGGYNIQRFHYRTLVKPIQVRG